MTQIGGKMRVPEEIRAVPRPANTVVYAFGQDPVKYNVKQRVFVEENGKIVQKDGGTIGAIIDGRFVENTKLIRYSESDILNWACSQLIVNLSTDLKDDLLTVYGPEDGLRNYAIAVLRTAENGIKDYELKDSYEQDYLSVMYPRIPLSKDSVGDHLYNLGRTYSRIAEFMELRASHVPLNHMIAIDGMLKSYESDDNPFSDFSRKALKSGTRDVLLASRPQQDAAAHGASAE